MRRINYLFFMIVLFLFVSVVNAETITVKRIGETREFNIALNDIHNSDTINIVEGKISFNKDYIEKVEIISTSNWKYKILENNNNIRFVSYLIGDFAENNDELFKIKIVFYDDVDLTKEELLLTDLVTNNGKDLFEFDDIKFKYEDVKPDEQVNSQSTPTIIGREEIKVELPNDELLDNQEEQEILIPEEELITEIKESNEKSSNNGVIAIVVCITCLIFSIIINSVIHLKTSQLVIRNNEKEIKLSKIEPMIKKPKRRGRKNGSKSKGDE